MNITSDIEKYINSQNSNIWDRLKDEYTFILLYDPFEHSWQSNTADGVATIIANTRNIDYASFSHELLHIYIDYLGMSSKTEIVYSVIEADSFDILIENDLISYIYNFCSHTKMYPYFKEMGFSEYNFVTERINFDQRELQLMKSNLSNKSTRPTGINQLIGHSLSLFNNVVQEDDEKCRNYLNNIESLNPDVFKLISDFNSKWKRSTDLDLTPLFRDFVDNLDNWIKRQR